MPPLQSRPASTDGMSPATSAILPLDTREDENGHQAHSGRDGTKTRRFKSSSVVLNAFDAHLVARCFHCLKVREVIIKLLTFLYPNNNLKESSSSALPWGIALSLTMMLIAVPDGDASLNSSPPNIVFILVDDMGWSDLGCTGSEIHTPTLDQLATEGLLMTQMHNTGKCQTSRAALLTGSYSQQVGTRHYRNSMTLGEVLKTAGYRTFAAGKHHAANNLFDRGFARFHGMRDGEGNHFNPGEQRPGEPAPASKKTNEFIFDATELNPWTPDADYYSTDRFTDWSLQFIDQAENLDDEQPWFLYLSYTAPHAPLQARPEDIAKYDGLYSAGFDAIADARYQRMIGQGVIEAANYPRSAPTYRNWNSLSSTEQVDQARRMQVYAAMLDRVDQNIARLLAHLEGLGELENTLILFASDNGAFYHSGDFGPGAIGDMDRWAYQERDWANVSNTPFRHGKLTSYEGGVATPFIAWWPGKIPAQSISHEPVHFIDVMPTLIEITGAEHQTTWNNEPTWALEGQSLWPLFEGGSIERLRPLFFAFRDSHAVIDYPWKLVRNGAPETAWSLYYLPTDRTETNDVAEEHPERVTSMAARHAQWLERCGNRTPTPPPVLKGASVQLR